MKQPTIVKILPITFLVALIATRFVHGRGGNETFLCEGVRCELGSGASWFFTGVSLIGPFIALGGFFWSRYLHGKNRLGPFSSRAVPDSEQILEVVGVLVAGLLAYWLALNGPSIEFVDIGKPNTWVESLREFRAPDVLTPDDRAKLDEVPSRKTWFLIGIIMGAPFMFSLGSMLGREWYGRKRRNAQRDEDIAQRDEDGTAALELDWTESEADTPIQE
jgi:hypothetical protein